MKFDITLCISEQEKAIYLVVVIPEHRYDNYSLGSLIQFPKIRIDCRIMVNSRSTLHHISLFEAKH